MVIHCAIYIRKSREEKDKPSQRLTVQREQLPAYAKGQGWSHTIYDDGHASAAQGKTESLKERGRLEADIRAGKVNIILTIELSRLSRDDSLQDYVAWLDLCSRNKVRLATMSRTLDPAQHSDWMLLLMEGGFSSVEMRVLKARMNEGWQQAWRAGKWLGGTPPPPYTYDLATSRPVIDPEQLPRMQQLWKMAETMSAKSIAETLGMPEIAVRRSISDERLLIFQAKRIDSDNLVSIPCDWEPCLDAEQAMKIRAGRRSRKNLRGARSAYSSLLSALGVVYCGYCGNPVKTWKGNYTKMDGSVTEFYGCNRISTTACDKSIMVRQDVLNQLLTENLINTLENTDHLKEYWAIAQGDVDPEKEIAALIKQERQEEGRKQRLIAAISEGVIDFADAKSQITEINNSIQGIKDGRKSIIERQAARFDFSAIAITRDEFIGMDRSHQRDIIKTAINRVTLYNSYAVVTYHFPRTPSGNCTSRLKLPPQQRPKKH